MCDDPLVARSWRLIILAECAILLVRRIARGRVSCADGPDGRGPHRGVAQPG